jgi:hypothetical protein
MKEMNNKTRPDFALPFMAFLLAVSFSCTERIDIELDGTYKRCVIFGYITTDTTTHKVTITSTGDYFNNIPPQGISNAMVQISDGENVFDLTEDISHPGTYYTDSTVYGIPGRTYTLFVDNVDLLGDGILKTYSASSELKAVADPDSIRVFFRPEWMGWVVQAFAQDPTDTKDFYQFLVWVNGDLHTDSLRNMIYTDDTFFNGNYTNGIEIYYFPPDEGIAPGDTITVGFCGITEDYYKYLVEAQTTSRPSVPLFSAPPANPRTNLNNDAIGFFTAFSVSRVNSRARDFAPLN